MIINIPETIIWPVIVTSCTIIFTLAHCLFKLDRMYKAFPKICGALIRISEALFIKGIIKQTVFTNESPLKLTPAGEQMLKDSGFDEFFNTNKEQLMKLVKAQNPKTPYDAEEASKKVMLEIDEKLPHFELIKNYSYNNGVPILKILLVCSVPLRDEVIKELKLT